VLSTVWTPQRCSQNYTEKRRGRKEREVARRIKEGIKMRETDPAYINSIIVLHSPEQPHRLPYPEKLDKPHVQPHPQ